MIVTIQHIWRHVVPAFLLLAAATAHAAPDAAQIQRLTERGKANGLLMQQKLDEALEILLRHRREAVRPFDRGEADFQIGYAYFYMGDDRRAVRYYKAGLEEMNEQGYLEQAMGFGAMYPFVLSDADKRHKLAYACFRMGKLKAAAAMLEPQRKKLEEFLKTNKNPVSQSTAYLSLIRVLNTLGQVQKLDGNDKAAVVTFERMVEACNQALAAQPVKMPGSTITLHFRNSQGLYETGQHTEALAAVDRCLAEVHQAWGAKAGKTTAESYYHSHRVRVLSALGRPDEALQCAETALQIAEADAMSNWEQPEAACQVAELSRQLNKPNEAEAAYKQAIDMIESIYVAAQRSSVRDGFLEAKVSVYPRLASLLAEQNRWGDSFAAAEAGRSRALLDMLGNVPARETGAARLSPELLKQDRKFASQMRELSRQAQMAAFNPQIDTRSVRQEYRRLQADYDRFRNTVALEHPGYAVFQTIQTVTEEDLQRLFSDNPSFKQSAMLSYLVSDDAVIGYCFDGSSLHGRLLSVGAAELRREIDQMRSQIAAQDAGWHALSRHLYDQLIKPFAAQIADKQRLLVMPHQSLHFLPFPLLCNDSKQTLIEHYEICTVPSASLLKLWSQPGRGVNAALSQAKAMVIANPDGSLPFAEREVQSVQRAYPEAAALIGDAAQEEKVIALAPTYDILHIATHGFANPVRPDYSHLKLAQPVGDSAPADGLLDVHEIVRRLDMREAKLVVLSACETAMGPASRGDEVQSLANAFLSAGAQQVVATLWAVDDQATAELMDDFYVALRDGHSPTSAMRSSMLRRAQAGRHPYEWGAFQVIGLH